MKLDPQDVQRVSRPLSDDEWDAVIAKRVHQCTETCLVPAVDAPSLQPEMPKVDKSDIFAPADGWYSDAESRN